MPASNKAAKNVSERQRLANVQNAHKSTGPRTAAGKRISSWNAVRHGLTAVSPTLPFESDTEYQDLRAGLLASWQPRDPQEEFLIDRLAAQSWRLLRTSRIENGLLEAKLESLHRRTGVPLDANVNYYRGIALGFLQQSGDPSDSLHLNFFRYDRQIQNAYYRALRAVADVFETRRHRRRPSAKPLAETVMPATANSDSGNGFVSKPYFSARSRRVAESKTSSTSGATRDTGPVS